MYRLEHNGLKAAAAAIAYARGERHGAPRIANTMDVLPDHLRREVMEDAHAALSAYLQWLAPSNAKQGKKK